MSRLRYNAGVLWNPLRPYRTHEQAFSPSELAAIREELLCSPYMSANNLNMRFEGTYGFSVVFRREGIPELMEHFPSIGHFLDRALARNCNAFFLNPLLMTNGSGVSPHRDFSLNSYCAETGLPRRVSVLYLQVPMGMQGGQLRLYRGDRLLAELAPREGRLLSFQGDLRHDVERIHSGAPSQLDARLSLVVEQYRVRSAALGSIPPFVLGSRRPAGSRREALGDPGEGPFGEALRRLL